MKDLAPEILRQRLVIEGIPLMVISDQDIKNYLLGLSDVLKMKTLLPPLTHKSEKFGWAGWIHWETSGAHFYAWEDPKLFFSVDIYTCKSFDIKQAIEYTSKHFNSITIEFKEF